MPLKKKPPPGREQVEAFEEHSTLPPAQDVKNESEEKDKDSGYEDFEDDYQDSDMDDSVVDQVQVREPAPIPAIPARSEKRASRMLENMMLELKSLDGSETKEADKASLVQESDPHELYLSSEEDASLSDDYEDSDFEVNSEEAEVITATATTAPTSRASRRKSQEDTARVVSFICVGKPQIVDIFLNSNQTSPSIPHTRHSMNLESLTSLNTSPALSPVKSTRRPSPLKLYPSTIRRMSISSITSRSSNLSAVQPSIASTTSSSPRKSRRLASIVTNTKASLQSATHSFLSSDPFATATSVSNNDPYKNNEFETPMTPKTPTSSAMWKRSISATLSKARKSSMPKMSVAYAAGAASPRSSNSNSIASSKLNLCQTPTTTTANASSMPEAPSSRPPTETEPSAKASMERRSSADEAESKALNMALRRSQTTSFSPRSATLTSSTSSWSSTSYIAPKKEEGLVTYNDALRNVIPAPPPAPATSPREKKGFSFGGMGIMSKRKSIKLQGSGKSISV